VLTQENQPMLTLQETHTPASGQFEPTISWEPGQVINTAEYFAAMQSGDTVEIAVTVVAKNAAGLTAGDGRVVRLVKKACDGPPCVGITEIDLNPFQWDNHPECQDNPDALGRTVDKRPPAIKVVPCFDAVAGRWKLEIARISMTIYYGVCTNNGGPPEWIYSTDQIISKQKACAVVKDFNRQIEQLDISVQSGFAQQPVPGQKGYNSYEAILLHEQLHAANLANHVREAYDKIKGDIRSLSLSEDVACDPAEVARRLKADKLKSDFEVQYSKQRSKWFGRNELESRRIQLAELRALVEELERDWGKCSG